MLSPSGFSGLGYRVMCEAEYSEAALGRWMPGPLVKGDKEEEAAKWLWPTRAAAELWLEHVQCHGEIGRIVKVPTVSSLEYYPRYYHGWFGIAIHVPISDLGPAI